jgi:hypothetical protein
MNRNPLNQEALNGLSLITILVVMGIVLFLFVHPYNTGSSPAIFFNHVIVCMLSH